MEYYAFFVDLGAVHYGLPLSTHFKRDYSRKKKDIISLVILSKISNGVKLFIIKALQGLNNGVDFCRVFEF